MKLPENLQQLVHQLEALKPQPMSLHRDELLFTAGQSAASRRALRFWQLGTICLALVTVALGWNALQPGDLPVISVRCEKLPPPPEEKSPPSFPASTSDVPKEAPESSEAPPYSEVHWRLRNRDIVLRWGIEFLPPAEPSTYTQAVEPVSDRMLERQLDLPVGSLDESTRFWLLH